MSARQETKRQAILAVAREVFLDEGFANASMSAIAARVGGSKGTLYNHFESKEALFEACIREQCGQFAADILAFDPEIPVAEALAELGRRYLRMLYDRAAIRTFQIIVVEATRTPELARVFYEAGPAVGLERLGAYLKSKTAEGSIAIPDCERAAGQFLALCRGHCHLRLMLNQGEPPDEDAIAAEVDEAVALFMARYAGVPKGP